MKKRSVALAIIFSIITFGIYAIYWFVCLTNDSNRICPEKATAGGGLAILFTIITCGIYTFYWHYRLGKKLGEESVAFLLLSVVGLGIIAWAIAQSNINALIEKQPA